MKTHFKSFGWLTAILIGATTFFTSCDKDDHVVRYVGKVVYAHTTDPFADCLVQITDGTNIHCMGTTNEFGGFVLSVRVAEINGNYYFHAGDKTCVPFETNLFGYGRDEVNLGTIEVEGPTLPTVTTKLGAITVNTAISGGEVTSDGRLSVTARGVCWSKSEFPTLEDEHTTNGEGKGEFQSKLFDLQANTTYYVRAYATNALGTAYGNQFQFTTKDGLPIVTTKLLPTATSTTITSGGTISSDGGYAITSRGVCYSTTNSAPTIADKYTTAGTGTGSFSTVITNVSFSTTYYVRAYATNSMGTAYGDAVTVKTGDGRPKVLTTTPTLNGTTIITGGQVTSDEGFEITARGVCYGTLPNPDLSNAYNHTNNGTGIGYFTSSFSISDNSGIFYVRAYATNVNGTTYGSQILVNIDYLKLPSFTYNGHVYRVAPTASTRMTLINAYNYCTNLELYGYSSWKLPSSDELWYMYEQRNTIGDFVMDKYWSSDYAVRSNNVWVEWVDFDRGMMNEVYAADKYAYVRPVRVEK